MSKENRTCKDCLHYQVCLVHCSESVLKNRGVCKHFIPPDSLVKRGRWIKSDMRNGMMDFKCSVCQSKCYVPTCMGKPMYEYCPIGRS